MAAAEVLTLPSALTAACNREKELAVKLTGASKLTVNDPMFDRWAVPSPRTLDSRLGATPVVPLSVIVTVAVAGVPRMPVGPGLLRVRLNVRVPADAVTLMIGTVKVALAWPLGMVRVPEVAV